MRFKNYETLLQRIGKQLDGYGICPHNASEYINEMLSKFSEDRVLVREHDEETEFELIED